MSDRPLREATGEALTLGISIAVIGMSIIAVVGLIVGFALTRRLSRLTATASHFARRL